MNLRICAFLAAVAIAWSSVPARDLKADLTAMAPSGQTVRLVYQKGGPPNENNGYGGSNGGNPNTAVYAVSSSDGVIRKIHPGGDSTGNYHCVNITCDGSRVVFYDFGRSQVVVVNYDGTSVKRFNAPTMYDYWCNPADNTEWAVCCDDISVTRYNINAANPATTAATVVAQSKLSSVMAQGTMSDALACSMSDDGTKILLCRDNGGSGASPALLTLSTGNCVYGLLGCWYMTRSGKNAAGKTEFSQNSGLGLNAVAGHRGPTIIDETGTVVQLVHVSDTMDSWLSKNPSYDAASTACYPEDGHAVDGLRWLRNRDYFSVIAERSKVGPILWRMTDSKWTYIEDNNSCVYIGDMDGITGTFSATGARARPLPLSQEISRRAGGVRTYAIDGRRLAHSAKRGGLRRGIVISQSDGGLVTRIYR